MLMRMWNNFKCVFNFKDHSKEVTWVDENNTRYRIETCQCGNVVKMSQLEYDAWIQAFTTNIR